MAGAWFLSHLSLWPNSKKKLLINLAQTCYRIVPYLQVFHRVGPSGSSRTPTCLLSTLCTLWNLHRCTHSKRLVSDGYGVLPLDCEAIMMKYTPADDSPGNATFQEAEELARLPVDHLSRKQQEPQMVHHLLNHQEGLWKK